MFANSIYKIPVAVEPFFSQQRHHGFPVRAVQNQPLFGMEQRLTALWQRAFAVPAARPLQRGIWAVSSIDPDTIERIRHPYAPRHPWEEPARRREQPVPQRREEPRLPNDGDPKPWEDPGDGIYGG
ncbi:MAG: hypothetical protein HQM16_07020 [Deltaproteobacteria bacterium]|nr:hypothetical protein [Deltaproteobacteria bacterium]